MLSGIDIDIDNDDVGSMLPRRTATERCHDILSGQGFGDHTILIGPVYFDQTSYNLENIAMGTWNIARNKIGLPRTSY